MPGAVPGREVVDTGAGALLPGFVEPHSHPVMSGGRHPAAGPVDRTVGCTDLAGHREDLRRCDRHHRPGHPPAVVRRLRRTAAPASLPPEGPPRTRPDLRRPNRRCHRQFRPWRVFQHRRDETAWLECQSACRSGRAHFGRNPDGSLNGQGFETAALLAVAGPVLAQLGNPLVSAAEYYAWMSRGGYTSTSDMTYDPKFKRLRSAGRKSVLPASGEHVGDVDHRHLQQRRKLQRR